MLLNLKNTSWENCLFLEIIPVSSPVNCVSFHPEGQLIVSGSWDATLKIWDVFHKTKKAVSFCFNKKKIFFCLS